MLQPRRSFTLTIIAVLMLIALCGLVWYWPLAAFAIVAGALAGFPIFSIVLGVVLDLLYQPPYGLLHMLVLPFTLLALASILARYLGKKFFSAGEGSLGPRNYF